MSAELYFHVNPYTSDPEDASKMVQTDILDRSDWCSLVTNTLESPEQAFHDTAEKDEFGLRDHYEK